MQSTRPGWNADIWMPGAFGFSTLDDLVTQEERYADFAAVKNDDSITTTRASTPMR